MKSFAASLPDDKTPISDLLDRQRTAFQRRKTRRKAEQWLPVYIPEHQGLPFGVAMVGDMHIDNPGCDVALLERDLALIANTGGMYGIFMGDGTDNWVGRLMSEYAKHSTSKEDGLRLLRWALLESGVDWLAGLMGNHDLWNDGAVLLDLMAGNQMYLPRWEARLDLRTAGQSWKVHCSHNFKGVSQWNPTHGPLKTAFMTSPAELLVAAHLHIGGTQSFEIPGQDRLVHVARARGYKFDDDYATQNGFVEHQHGATVLAVFDPQAKLASQRIQLFYDLEQGAEYLSAIRKYREWKNAPKPMAKRRTAKKPAVVKPKRTKKPAAKRKPARRRKAA